MDIWYVVAVIASMSLVTFLLRAVPFVASKWLTRQKWVKTLGEFLPLSIMVLLVLHTMIDSAMSSSWYGMQELAAISLTVVLQYFYRNSLCSIFAGTILYLLLKNITIAI